VVNIFQDHELQYNHCPFENKRKNRLLSPNSLKFTFVSGKRIKVGKVIFSFFRIAKWKKVGTFDMKTGWLIERQMTKSPELIPTDFILITVQQFRITKV